MSDPKEVTVTIGESGLASRVEAAGHELAVDEPVTAGGSATGPDPYAYLLVALGSCTAMTLRMYADRKGWPLRGVETRLSHSRIWARDCEDCEHKTGQISVIEREIALQGPLDDDQKARLMEIADRCPVHRTLTGEVKIRTRPLQG